MTLKALPTHEIILISWIHLYLHLRNRIVHSVKTFCSFLLYRTRHYMITLAIVSRKAVDTSLPLHQVHAPIYFIGVRVAHFLLFLCAYYFCYFILFGCTCLFSLLSRFPMILMFFYFTRVHYNNIFILK